MKRLLLLSLIVVLSLPTGCSTADEPLDGSGESDHAVIFTAVGGSLGTADLVDMAFLPGTSNHAIVIAKSGLVFYLGSDFVPLDEVAQVETAVTGDQGLLGLAVDPDYPSNRFVYLFLTDPDGGANRVDRVTVSVSTTSGSFSLGDRQTVIAMSKASSPSPGTDGNGGGLAFDDDGNLFVGVGDGGGPSSSDVTLALAQSSSLRLGKILRIVPVRTTGSGGYGIPSGGNGFGAGALPEIWAIGLRNPFRLVWGDGRLFVSDPSVAYEEIDAAATGGANFGWPLVDGPAGNPSFVDPLHGRAAADTSFADADPEENPSGRSIRVLAWYDGGHYGDVLENRLLYGDGPAGWVRALSLDGTGAVSEDLHRGHQLGLARLTAASDGRLYGVALHHSTRVLRVDLP